ncbi:MAG TPA: hypothetical protein VF663_08670 [Telluria sp.]|jgi:hypothetical protein
MAEPGAMAQRMRAAITSLRFWALACFGLSLLPMAWYEYVAWIVPAWTPRVAGSAPVQEPNYVILLILCAVGTAVGAGVASGLSIASYQVLPRPRPGGRLTECVVITGVHAITVLFLISLGIYLAIG